MPSQKRNSSSDNNLLHHDDSQQQHSRRKQSRRQRGGAEDDDEDERDYEQDEEEEEQVKEEDEDSEDEDSDGSRSSDDPANQSEWVLVKLPALRTYVQCPICLGIIKKTRTVMECLHRFCRECIDKSMRMGNNECPACRTHCASRRSLRDDPRFDALIEILYDDIEKYEEEELAFHEEEKTRNKQIQASIAQIFRRQSEALVTRRKLGKDTDSASGSRLPRKYSRRRRNTRETEHEGSDDEDENNHDANKDSSSNDERTTEIKQRRYKRKAGAQSSQPSPSAANSDGGGNENDLEASRESKGTSSGPVRNTEMLAWGGGGARSKSVRNTRIMKLAKYLENAKDNDELDVHLTLISLDKQRTASSKELYLCCPPCFSVKSLKEYVSRETQLQAEDIEILLGKKHLHTNGLQSTRNASTLTENEAVLQNLKDQETLAGLGAKCDQDNNHLVLAYRVKKRD
ncbi:putative E3 ubiquitin-protein ligase RING1a isoform X1 [Camellia sinensis]|uniref:putative E3 ubiquitin-protein ligase RING1a isoform X1 n=1 Tax=Camellia sinensis TaxID=4442 RepID=UPI00103554AD|nr:putative E3 ubiquitin-protein ligase RING1a isoform X1 [Camellia sinensis]